jgi:hypothetical protein
MTQIRPLLGNEYGLVLLDVKPFVFMLENLADRAALYPPLARDILLSCVRMVARPYTNVSAICIPQAMLLMFERTNLILAPRRFPDNFQGLCHRAQEHQGILYLAHIRKIKRHMTMWGKKVCAQGERIEASIEKR